MATARRRNASSAAELVAYIGAASAGGESGERWSIAGGGDVAFNPAHSFNQFSLVPYKLTVAEVTQRRRLLSTVDSKSHDTTDSLQS